MRARIFIAVAFVLTLAVAVILVLWASQPSVSFTFIGYLQDDRRARFALTNATSRYVLHLDPVIQIYSRHGWTNYDEAVNWYRPNLVNPTKECCLIGPHDSHFDKTLSPLSAPLPPGPCRWRASVQYRTQNFDGPSFINAIKGLITLGFGPNTNYTALTTPEFQKP
jgi:hypothetical protein